MIDNPKTWLIVGGLTLGAIFGAVVRQQRMCLVNAVSNVSLVRDYRYLLGFALAMLIAITGTQLLEMADIVAVQQASYRDARLDWLGVILGGLVFGIGATYAGGDAARVVILAGQGDKAGWIAVFFFAIFASVAQFGLLEKTRVYLLLHSSMNLTGGDAGLAALSGAPKWLMLVIVDVLLLGFIVSKIKQHADTKILLAGLLLGLTVIGAWYTTGVLAQDEFEPVKPSGMTVSGPMSRIGNMFVSGDYPALSFSISFVIGLIAISFLLSILTGKFRFSPVKGSAGHIAFGGALMGIGGTFGYGCNIGQGFTGISTLSLESVLAVLAMIVGIHLATKFMEKHTN